MSASRDPRKTTTSSSSITSPQSSNTSSSSKSTTSSTSSTSTSTLTNFNPIEDSRIRVHFVKCPIKRCYEFALNDAKNTVHLDDAHKLKHRCQASTVCVVNRINFDNISELLEHLKRAHGDIGGGTGQHYCFVCRDGPFTEYQALVKHITYTHAEGNYSCAKCKFSFKYRWKILVHYRRYHSQEEESGGCDQGADHGGRPVGVKRRFSEVED